jgi:hypothetical protein
MIRDEFAVVGGVTRALVSVVIGSFVFYLIKRFPPPMEADFVGLALMILLLVWGLITR